MGHTIEKYEEMEIEIRKALFSAQHIINTNVKKYMCIVPDALSDSHALPY